MNSPIEVTATRMQKPTPPSTIRKAANFAGFQAGWFACALTAGAGQPMWGPGVVALILCLHVVFCERRVGELKLLGSVFLIGGAIDSLQWLAGISIAPAESMPTLLAPLWFATLYANFATSLRFSLAWLGSRPVLAALLGATGGPITYRGGVGFGAIELHDPEWMSLLLLALVWGVLTPGFFVLERWLRRRDDPVEASTSQ